MKMQGSGYDQPFYRQIYEDLNQKIHTGQLRYMEQIPALPALCQEYGVSESPVRRAIDELARAGLVVKRRGRGQGTFVVKRLATITFRVLLVAGADLYRSTVAAYHEIFDLLDGIREATLAAGNEMQMVSLSGFDTLPPGGANTVYLVIAMTWEEYEQGARLAERSRTPCILVNPPRAGYPCVRVDMEQGAYLGTNYLAQIGHRQIAYVGSTESDWFLPESEGIGERWRRINSHTSRAWCKRRTVSIRSRIGWPYGSFWLCPNPLRRSLPVRTIVPCIYLLPAGNWAFRCPNNYRFAAMMTSRRSPMLPPRSRPSIIREKS